MLNSTFDVKILHTVGKVCEEDNHHITAPTADDAHTWGHKQAQSLHLDGPVVIVSDTVTPERG